jgi:RNA polymerase sigma-70 factor, ECF subfamily
MTPHAADTRTAKIIEAQEGFKRYGQRLLGYTDSEDISQETALRVWMNRHRLAKDGDVVPYGFTIAGNLSRDLIRRSKRLTPGGLDACSPRTFQTADPDPTKRALCNTAMSCLDARQTEIIRRYYWDGLTTAEIGDQLGISEGLVQVTLHRCRRKMRERLLQ